MNKQDIVLPELGEGVVEGEIIKFLVCEGDVLTIDQTIAEVMTDKASMEVPSPLAGKVETILVKEGDTVKVGDSILTVTVSEQKPQKKLEESSGLVEQTKSEIQIKIPSTNLDTNFNNEIDSAFETDSSVLATPITRKLAQQLGVNLTQLQGSGLAGRITKEDLLKYCNKSDSTSFTSSGSSASLVKGFSISPEEHQKRYPLKGIRKKISEKMQQAKAVIPHFTLVDSANIEQLEKLKNTVKTILQEKDIKVTYLAFIMKTLVQSIKEYPEINASIDDVAQEVVIKNYYHFGFAVDTERGLLVPVIRNVDQKSIAQISLEIQTLAQQSREGKIKLEDISNGTITITNIGSIGGEYATPIINAPEVAILGMYRIDTKPVWDGSAFQPQKTMNFSFTCDHRLIDGAVSARVMKSFIHKIENPLSVFI